MSVSLYIRSWNQQSHLHATGCGCKITDRYEHVQDFPTYDDSVKVWEVNNELGTIHHQCLEGVSA
jgi:hypothetical protein